MKSGFLFIILSLIFFTALARPLPYKKGNVIFFHPDGMSVATWGAIRISTVGPDGRTEWDRLPHMAVYTGHMKDSLAATSNGGATTHAYGVKVAATSFGTDGREPVISASGVPQSILEEARESGTAIALVQSGAITEPGTAAFIAKCDNRDHHFEITRQTVMANLNVVMAGGEKYMLPQGVQGRFGVGTRTDGLNMIEEAKKLGYTVVYTKTELNEAMAQNKGKMFKLFGVFAYDHTFFDETEEDLAKRKLPLYLESAPTIGEMTEAALKIVSHNKKGFFIVAEEEGSDNFANANNASGVLEAGRRADENIGVIRRFIEKNPNTMMVMTSDSDAGGLGLHGAAKSGLSAESTLPATDKNGAPIDGLHGASSKPFTAPADKNGKQWPYAISWATKSDVAGGILVRGVGLNSDLIKGTMDNTDVYKVMYKTLFGRAPSDTKMK